MPIAVGIAKQLVYKKEVTFGVAPGATAAQYLRRVTSNIDLKKETYESNEIRTDYQVSDMRHGVRTVDGSLNGELSVGTYKDFFAAALRKDFLATAAIAGASITIAGSAGAWTITRAAGSYLTDGIKIGDVIRLSVGAFNASNLAKNLLIIALTATVATCAVLNGSALVGEGPIVTSTVTVIGKKSWTPTTGHTDDSFSIEHFYSDIAQSELFLGCKISSVAVKLPATGLSTVDISVMGKDLTTATAAYYTSPTALSAGANLAAVNGALYVGGVAVALLTGIDFTIDGGHSAEAVVGSNTKPEIFEGRVKINGNMTVFFQDAVFRDYFVNETEVSVVAAFTGGNTAAADFVTIVMPRVKVGGSSKDDGEKGIIQTVPFTALFNTAGGAGTSSHATTLSIQDSLA